jgi:hypothetical protein
MFVQLAAGPLSSLKVNSCTLCTKSHKGMQQGAGSLGQRGGSYIKDEGGEAGTPGVRERRQVHQG